MRAAAGSLVIAGGGTFPEEARRRFLALAGGERAAVVIIPTASKDADDPAQTVADFWGEVPAHGTFTLLHTRDRDRANDPEFSEPLRKATGVWISGGRQGALMDAYDGTLVETAVHGVLNRGGVVGGKSAGAAAMSDVMIAGGRDAPVIGSGFGLLPRAIVDQHFSERGRLGRLLAALKAHPDHAGIGIDENTAVIVSPEGFCVVGEASVTVCEPRGATTVLWSGERRNFSDTAAVATAGGGR